ncbi:MAG TPA: ATP-binding protein, partial [Fimbriimonadaceae bacterium]|nr:ATP-binding protein [Fimbriimonadaceae bacterium]
FALAMRAIRDARARAQHEAAHAAHLEERVQSRTAELELANRELESFSYSVSHDLRAPLRAMTGFSRELEEDFGPSLGPEGKLLTSRIHDNARRMSQIIDDLLLLSKTTRGEVNRQRVNLSHLFSEAFAQALARHPRSASEVIVQPDVEVEADPRMIEPLVENLARNAWKFSRDSNPSRVEFGETVIEGERTFFVRDNGVGFDAELFERALQPFERLVSNREFEGTGVGLAICDRVVRRHDGRMWADSAPGKGATIYFTLSAEPR